MPARRTTDNCTTYTHSLGNPTGISPPNSAGCLAARAYTYDGFGRLKTDNGRGLSPNALA